MIRWLAVLTAGAASCTPAHRVPTITAPDRLPAALVCGIGVVPPARATLTVRLADETGAAPERAEIRIEPCCSSDPAACRPSATDALGRAVVEACPTGRTNDVIVRVDTNPRWFTFTPPRSVRVCAELIEVRIPLQRHPPPPT